MAVSMAWGRKGLLRSGLRLLWLRNKISFLALCLNSLPRVLEMGTSFTFHNHKGRSRCLGKQNHHPPWAPALSNSKKQTNVLMLIFLFLGPDWIFRWHSLFSLTRAYFRSQCLYVSLRFLHTRLGKRLQQYRAECIEIRKRIGAERGVWGHLLSIVFISGTILPHVTSHKGEQGSYSTR